MPSYHTPNLATDLTSAVMESAMLHAGRTALVVDRQATTYRELTDRSRMVAAVIAANRASAMRVRIASSLLE